MEYNKKVLTLVIIRQGDKVLLGMKKRGFGQGKWNGFGGKVNEGESIENAARRELLEEAGIRAADLAKMGVLEFSWQGKEGVHQVHIFKCTKFEGQPQETEEMRPQWFLASDIPFAQMWADDVHWMPLFLENKNFTGAFLFDASNAVIKSRLHENSHHI